MANAAPRPPEGGQQLRAPSTRELLATLRATLRGWGGATIGAAELTMFDGWARWVMYVLAEDTTAAPISVRSCGAYEAARELALEVSARVIRAGADLADDVRRAHWAQAEAGERLVWALLKRASQEGGSRAKRR